MTLADWEATGREIAVIGLGRSGVAAARFLRARGLPVYASDARQDDTLTRAGEALTALGAAVELGRHDLGRIARAGGVVLSPGVPPDALPVEAARQAGVVIRAECDVGFEALEGVPCVAVTGTNGKTTTTALVAHLLRAGGLDAAAAGNIGTPLCEIALQAHRPSWLAVELSSFQLHDTPRVAPAVGILTNLAPDHLDRYPTLEAYYADKRLLYRNAGPDSRWVTNGDDAAALELAAGVPGRHFRFAMMGRADGWFDRERAALVVRDRIVILRQDLRLLGDHNVANALAAAVAVSAVGVGTAALAEGLRSFAPLPHRMEPVREVDGILWVNDSKATNVAATRMAVSALDRPFVLLLGGRHKGQPYTDLGPLLAGRCRAVVAYGEARPLIRSDLAGVTSVTEAATLEDALHRAGQLAVSGDAVLLSPACSSFDLFGSYAERGQAFRAWVESR
jgi:UDP-N-acetylmuramoylalanine--D-glutamate ligase